MAPRRLSRVALLIASSLIACATLTGCLTGERPTLASEESIDAPVGEAEIDAVLARFAALAGAEFTATYQITNNFGPVTRQATVVHAADGRRAITVGDVRYLIDSAGSLTCRPTGEGDDAVACTEGADDAAISDLQVTHQFFGRSTAARLRTDATRRTGPAEGYEATIGGREAGCVSIVVSGGSKVYCVLDEGPVAAYQGPDVLIELLEFSPSVDESAFVRP